MEIITQPPLMQRRTSALNRRGIGFVPTMGALHDGHLSLIKKARDENQLVVVSIFVNPTQFAQGEDFDKYPKDCEKDKELLEANQVDILFMPEAAQIYKPGHNTVVTVTGLSDKLCGFYRPGHFQGVATIVLKLLNIVCPEKAYFGQKDYQQALIIKRMVEDLNLNVDIVVCPTVRETDGLALSSRNRYLSTEERKDASLIYKAMIAAEREKNLVDVPKVLRQVLSTTKHITEIQYASVYDPLTLEDITHLSYEYEGKEVLMAVAVKLGQTRLIDNKKRIKNEK